MNLGEFEAHVSGFIDIAQRFLGSRKHDNIVAPLRAQIASSSPNHPTFGFTAIRKWSHYASLDYLTALRIPLMLPDAGYGVLDRSRRRADTSFFWKASRYVGVDYSEEMVRFCRTTPHGISCWAAQIGQIV
jgi:hypothetical protein